MSKELQHAQVRLFGWLVKEEGYQFRHNTQLFGSDAEASIRALMGDMKGGGKIRSRWRDYQQQRASRPSSGDPDFLSSNLRASQHLLKATSDSRAAAIWNGVIIGRHSPIPARAAFRQANFATRSRLQTHFNRLNTGQKSLPPADHLDMPLEDAIAPYGLRPVGGEYNQAINVYLAIADLALTHILEQQKLIGSMDLPIPGVPTGDISVWRDTPEGA